MRLNVIVGNKSERFPRLIKELSQQGIEDYDLWNGIYLTHSIKQSINASHKQIVQYAKLAEWGEVAIGEDDFKATHRNSWNYFLNQKPKDFDIYLGSVFTSEPYGSSKVDKFTGLTWYIVSQKFYDKFLEVPSDAHIDQGLAYLGDFIVCRPMVVTQYDGISANTGKFETYEPFFAGQELYNG